MPSSPWRVEVAAEGSCAISDAQTGAEDEYRAFFKRDRGLDV
jgi:hypothetical protein